MDLLILAVFSLQYLLASCFNVAHCRAISFLCTGRIFVERILFLCIFRFYLCLLTYIINSVSAVPVGALDRVAGLLNRNWWQR